MDVKETLCDYWEWTPWKYAVAKSIKAGANQPNISSNIIFPCWMKKCMLDEAKFRVWWTYFKTLKKKFGRQQVHSFQKIKMVDKSREAVMVMLLNEPIDSDCEKPTSGKKRELIRTREENGYFFFLCSSNSFSVIVDESSMLDIICLTRKYYNQ